jgi:uncharacterized protein (TIGR03437 family)
MKKALILCAVTMASALTAAGQPSIAAGGILNNASYIPSGLPNADIAQGSIFVIFGSILGPSSTVQQPSYPLQTTLGGTSVKVTVNGTTVDAIPIYTSATQVGAILPSRTPVGTGTVTVTYNNQTSAAAPIKVVPSSFGVFTLNQAGSGPGIVTNANYQTYGPSSSAHSGDTIIIWGTGLGPITDSETDVPNPKDLTDIHLQVYIGGKQATVTYRGRSGCCSGLDQIVAQVPQGVEGCYVPVVIVINGVVSNSTTIPIVSGNGNVCSDTNGLSSSDWTTLLGKGNFSLGSISISRSTVQTAAVGNIVPASKTTIETGAATFVSYNSAQFAASQGLFQQSSFGSCVVSSYQGQTQPGDPIHPTILDAGPAINVAGPNGTKQLTKLATGGVYAAQLGGGQGPTALPQFIPDNGGTFTFDNGSGGADVKSFSNVKLSVPTTLVWTNMDAITNVQRSQGLPITWSGGDPNSYVTITGGSFLTSPVVATIFSCTEKVSAGSFTVPSYVLLAMPASAGITAGGFTIPTASLSVFNNGVPVKFSAPGVDQAYALWSISASKQVNYQ